MRLLFTLSAFALAVGFAANGFCAETKKKPAGSKTSAVSTAPTVSAASTASPTSPAAAKSTSPAPADIKFIPMEVTINGQKSGTWLFVEDAGVLYVEFDAFDEWRIVVNDTTKTKLFKNRPFWPLTAIPGYNANIDFANQSVALAFSATSFATTRLLGAESKRPKVSPVMNSLFVNYDINYAKTYLDSAPNLEDLSMLTEAGFSSELGVLTSSATGRNLTGNKALGARREWIRLETTFHKNLPDYNLTLRLGDSSTRSGMLGRNVFFGGIQLGTNFGLSPGFVTQPLPSLTGLSAAPSTVELYINDVLRQTSEVPTGPFAINNFPVLTGSGEARMVVRDLLGRETVIQQSFFTNSQLLAPGLNDWSIEAGSIRRNLGTRSGQYGATFASGLFKRGINNRFTMEARGAYTPDSNLFELGAVTALPLNLLGKSAITSSRTHKLGSGAQWLLGLEYQGLHWGTSLQAQGAERNFRELGQEFDTFPIDLQIAGNISYSSERWGTFGLGYASIQSYDSDKVTTISGNYSVRVGSKSNLSLSVSEAKTGDEKNRAVGFNITMPLDNNLVASAFANSAGPVNDGYLTLQKSPSQDDNWGWRLLAGQQQNHGREEAGAYYFGRHGTLTADISNLNNQTALRLGANGSALLADGHVFMGERISDSFAVVEVKDYGDVGVGIGSNSKAKTDAKGVAFVPHLSAYQKNSLRLNPQDLPLDAEIDSIEQEAVPAWRSGVKVTFPVRSGRAALLKIELEDKEPVPVGAEVKIKGDTQTFIVGRRGEAFVSGLQPYNDLDLTWQGQTCTFTAAIPAKKDGTVLRIGPILCKGVKR